MNYLANDTLLRLGLLSLQLAVVSGAAWLLARALRRHAAAVRHAVWASATMTILLLPLAAALLPRVDVATAILERAAPGKVLVDVGPGRAPANRTIFPAAPPSDAVAVDPRVVPGLTFVPPLVVAVYFAGCALLLARLVAGMIRVRRIRARSATARLAQDLGLGARTPRGRAVAVCTSTELAAPITFGLVRPVVVVPAGFASWSREAQRNALHHEYAHVDRYDWAPHLLSRLLCCIYWFHPLAWLTAGHLKLESELACDDRVLGTGAPAAAYAEQLVAWTRRARDGFGGDPAIAISGGRHLRIRVRSILDEDLERAPMSPTRTRILTALILSLGCAVAAFGPATATPVEVRARHETLAGQTPLMRAARSGDDDEVRRLLAAGDDVNATRRGQGTALMHAVAGGHTATVHLLLDAGADPNLAERQSRRARGLDRTALTTAARHGNPRILQALLDAGAEVRRLVPGDPTALMAAARGGHTEAVRILLLSGADADRRVPGDGSPLIEASRAGSLEIARLLVGSGADVNAAVPGDGNPLIAAVRSRRLELVRFLLEHGADPEIHVAGDDSALAVAAENGESEILRLLLAGRER